MVHTTHLQAHSSRQGKLARALVPVGPGDLHLRLHLQHLRHHKHVVPTVPQLLQDLVFGLPQPPIQMGSQDAHWHTWPWARGLVSLPGTSALCTAGDAAEKTRGSVDTQSQSTWHSLPRYS